MPLTFPSHQGLIAPLWRRWPERFHVLGLCIGATAPDIVDGVLGAYHGSLGHRQGHTLAGLFLLCLPTGLLLTWLAVALGRRSSRRARGGLAVWRWSAWLGRHIESLDSQPPRASRLRRTAFVAFSVWLGALSHLFFDGISHGRFVLLQPWCGSVRLFPSWWYVEWFALPIPGYRGPYPIGPPCVVWVLLSLLGAVMLFRPWLGTRHGE